MFSFLLFRLLLLVKYEFCVVKDYFSWRVISRRLLQNLAGSYGGERGSAFNL